MDVTLPTGVAMNSGTPPTGGVSDVLAQLAGTLAQDSFAALLATPGSVGGETAGGLVDDEGDLAQDPALAALTALAASGWYVLPLPATQPVVVGPGGAGNGGATALRAPGEVPAASEGAGAAAAAVATATAPAVSGTTSQPAAPDIETALGAPVASAEAGEAVPAAHVPRRDAMPDAPAAAATAKDAGAAAARTIAAVSGTDPEPYARRDGHLPGASPAAGPAAAAPTTTGPTAAVHVPVERPRETAPVEAASESRPAPDSQPALPRVDAPVLAAGEPKATPRRHEPLPSRPEVSAAVHQPTGAESLSSAPRAAEATPTAAQPTAPPAAPPAARHEPPTLPETSRPLGRLPEGGEMRLEVSPEGLGPIEIRVAVRADAVQATLWTQQDHARAALEAHRPMLADALGRSSLRLEEFTVGVGQHQHPAQDDDGAPRRWANPAAAESVAAPTPTYAPARPRGLSLRA